MSAARRGAQPSIARGRRLLDHVHRLARPILAQPWHARGRGVPEVADGARLADHHPGARRDREVTERLAAGAGRNDVRAEVAERGQAARAVCNRREPAEPAPLDVLEEDALDGVLRAEREHLLPRRLGELQLHARSLL